MRKFNEEQYEAQVSEIERQRKTQSKNLPKEDLENLKKIENLVEELKKLNLPFYLFVPTPHFENFQYKAMTQYNNIYDIVKPLLDSNGGEMNSEIEKVVGLINSQLISLIFNMFTVGCDPNIKTYDDALENFNKTLKNALLFVDTNRKQYFNKDKGE